MMATRPLRMELGNLGDHKPVGQGVYEHRIHFGPGYRVYFGRAGAARVILVGGGAKARQSQDIAHARRLWELYKERRRRESR